jgi:phytoene dehydrogenase-like protein
MADPQYWLGLAPAEYRQQKKALVAAQLVVLDGLVPGARDHAVFLDAFTPRTIARYTGHINGAVYGSPRKCRDGRTPLSNLYLCGTDQGFLGITGSMLSGVSIANAYLLA